MGSLDVIDVSIKRSVLTKRARMFPKGSTIISSGPITVGKKNRRTVRGFALTVPTGTKKLKRR